MILLWGRTLKACENKIDIGFKNLFYLESDKDYFQEKIYFVIACYYDIEWNPFLSFLKKHENPPLLILGTKTISSEEKELLNHSYPSWSYALWYGDCHGLGYLIEYGIQKYYQEKDNNNSIIILVENDDTYFSLFIPVLMKIMNDCLYNLESYQDIQNKRPIILHYIDKKSALDDIVKYKDRLLFVATSYDIQKEEGAGAEILKCCRSLDDHLPVVLTFAGHSYPESFNPQNGLCLWKDSPHFVAELQDFLMRFCGFDAFQFMTSQKKVWATAGALNALIALIQAASCDILQTHQAHQDFTRWLSVHGYPEYAQKTRLISCDIHLRENLLRVLQKEEPHL